MSTDLFLVGILQGMILSLVTYAVMIPFRLLNFPDLTAEGAYPLGGAITAGIVFMGLPPVPAIFLSALGAGLMNVTTGVLHLKFKVNSLLAGIILSTMIYSINLRILTKPNVALFNFATIFYDTSTFHHFFAILMILMIFLISFALFLYTDFGLKFRAVGLNVKFCLRNNISISHYLLFGLFISGCLSGMAGSLMAQMQNYMDIGMGVGIVIHALAALMLGEILVGQETLTKQLIAPLIGALLYQQIQGMALSIGLAPSDLKFFTGALVLTVIASKRVPHHAKI